MSLNNGESDSSATDTLKFALVLTTSIYENTNFLKGKTICFAGQGPYLINDLKSIIPPEITTINLDEETIPASGSLEYCVVGRTNFDQESIIGCINGSQGLISFLPQEGFLDLVLFGFNWWTTNIAELNDAREYHEGLQYVYSLVKEGFAWPTTEATESIGEPASGSDAGFQDESPLHMSGYMIWNKSKELSDAERWHALTGALRQPDQTLEQVTNHIAGLVRARKTQPDGAQKFRSAISKWEADLARLKREFYDGKNNTFRWPNTR